MESKNILDRYIIGIPHTITLIHDGKVGRCSMLRVAMVHDARTLEKELCNVNTAPE